MNRRDTSGDRGFAEIFSPILRGQADAEQPEEYRGVNQKADQQETSVSKARSQAKLERAARESGREDVGGGEERRNPRGLQL